MNNILIADTNFLVNNTGKNKEIKEELENKDIKLYIPELVKTEFINIQLRKLDDVYGSLDGYKKIHAVWKLKYVEKSEAEEILEKSYDALFEKYFKESMILLNKEDMIDRVLERNKYKLPPFIKESNSSDKGFKDSMIFLSIKDFIIKYDNDANFYFITLDNGFTKNKLKLEKEKIKLKYMMNWI